MDDRARWLLTRARDPKADGTFVYAVKTTHIFCRPTCPARLAQLSNITFFDTASEAEEAGFRACKRCKPEIASYAPDSEMLKAVCKLLDELAPNDPTPSLSKMAAAAELTEAHFHRKFKKATGLTPKDFATQYQQKRQANYYNTACSGEDGLQSEADSADSGYISPAVSMPQLPDLDRVNAQATLTSDMLGCQVMESPETTPFTTVYFTVKPTCYGQLSVAFAEGRIAHLQLVSSLAEGLQGLWDSFPGPSYLLLLLDDAPPEERLQHEQHIDEIIQALESPSGKSLDLPLSSRLQTEYTASHGT